MNMSAVEEFKAIYMELRREVDCLLRAKDVPDTQPVLIPDPKHLSQVERRAAVRSFGAFIDAVTYSLKQFALQLPSARRMLRAPEWALASEETYELSEKGEPVVRGARLRALSNLRFAFALFAKVCSCDFVLEVGGSGWQKLKALVELRDRLMHPKRVASLNVTDTEIVSAVEGCLWFDSQALKLLASTVLALADEYERLNEMLAKAKRTDSGEDARL
jgi:hypothetical protein